MSCGEPLVIKQHLTVFGRGIRLLLQQRSHFAQGREQLLIIHKLIHIDDGKRPVPACAVPVFVEIDEVVYDLPAQFKGVISGGLPEQIQPSGIILPVPRLCFRRNDQEVRIIGKRQVDLDAAHEARVKINEIKFLSALRHIALSQCLSESGKGHHLKHVGFMFIFGERVAERTAAMIPEDQVVFLRRKVSRAVIDERFQCIRR